MKVSGQWLELCSCKYSWTLSVCIRIFHLHLSPSLWFRCCVHLGRHQLSFVPFTYGIMGGILWGFRVQITLLPHVQQEQVVCAQIKVLVILLFAGGFTSAVFLLFFFFFFMPLAPFDCLLPVLSFSLSLLFPVPPVPFQLKLWMILNFSLSVVPLDWGGRLGCLVMAT